MGSIRRSSMVIVAAPKTQLVILLLLSLLAIDADENATINQFIPIIRGTLSICHPKFEP